MAREQRRKWEPRGEARLAGPTGENYKLWHGSSKNKQNVAQVVVEYLVTNGIQGCDA
ncbi:hypothetical protein VP01_1815g1 [Puccinia sorghi]|uniref:Uncharacterized protein n=1 Tax=Puccinia sorghi TaxID=27349 RepID=A0A0L6VE68_9BASI|nr:hypothetical protein VP01_1815g1 [Puccinia sorghi]